MLCGRGQRWEPGGRQVGDRQVTESVWRMLCGRSRAVGRLAWSAVWPTLCGRGALEAASTRSSCDWPCCCGWRGGLGPVPCA